MTSRFAPNSKRKAQASAFGLGNAWTTVQSICVPKISPLSGPVSEILADVTFVTDVFIANSYLIGDSSGSPSRTAYLMMMNLVDSLRIKD